MDAAEDDKGATPLSQHPFTQVPVEITVSVGKARPRLSDLLRMGQDAILPLDSHVDDPVELYVGDRLIARGALQELEGGSSGQLVVRLTEVADLKSGL
ncbi:FliM/FliN family flagellar motor switch protein [Palleronia pelagia]|nr:FliM/FliN family flagellar motor switch protein [Palleronia pelagia]